MIWLIEVLIGKERSMKGLGKFDLRDERFYVVTNWKFQFDVDALH